ncbi:hypothetical protein LINPERPRIM_LOCUS41206 [Linum perenne]
MMQRQQLNKRGTDFVGFLLFCRRENEVKKKKKKGSRSSCRSAEERRSYEQLPISRRKKKL